MPRNVSSHSTWPGAFRDIFVNISSTFNLAMLCQTYLIFYLNDVDDLVSKFNQSMGLIIPALLVLLHLKYQSTSNPFDTHPYTMGVAVLSFFAYYLARSLHERCSSSLRRVSALSLRCMVWFGDIAVASLMFMFLPDWIQPIIYIVFGLISAAQFLQKLFVDWTGSTRHFSLNNLGRFFYIGKSLYSSKVNQEKARNKSQLTATLNCFYSSNLLCIFKNLQVLVLNRWILQSF